MSGPFQDAIAGAVGAVVSTLSTYPLDVAKTRLQAQNRDVNKNGLPRAPKSPPASPLRCRAFSGSEESEDDMRSRKTREHTIRRIVSGPTPYQGTFDCLRRIVAEEGCARLFVGLQAKCVYSALTNFVFFYLLRAFRPLLGRFPMVQGMGAGVGVQLVVLRRGLQALVRFHNGGLQSTTSRGASLCCDERGAKCSWKACRARAEW